MLCLSTWWRRTVAASYSTIAVTHKMINDVMYVDDSRVEWAQIWCLDMQQYRLDHSSSRIPGMKPYNELSIWMSIAQNSMTFWWLTAFVCLACNYKRRLSIIFVLFPIQINIDWYMLECFKCIIGGHCIYSYIIIPCIHISGECQCPSDYWRDAMQICKCYLMLLQIIVKINSMQLLLHG